MPTITYRTAATGDDGYESVGVFTTGAAGFRLGDGGSAARSSFARWTGVTIPAGATINSAKVTLSDWWNESTAAGVTSQIRAQDAGNPSAPADAAAFTAAARTSQSVTYTIASGTNQVTGTLRDTPDLTTVIQYMVNTYSYGNGSALTLFFDFVSVTAARQLVFDSWDDDTLKGPLLTIDYSVGGGQPSSIRGQGIPGMGRIQQLSGRGW